MNNPEDPTTELPAPGGEPSRFGPFWLLRHLGSGAWGTVHLAEVLEARPYAAPGDRVAIKLLAPDHAADPDTLRRFRREAEIGKAVDHPSVVRTHEVGTALLDGEERPFLAMEYVEGRTLQAMMNDLGTVPEALLRALAVQSASALHAVHERGAVHRDLKPSNILITPDHRVKLMDLGIAFLIEESVRLTRTGYFIGTLSYASPEQLRSEPVGPRSDLYSLGVVLYQAATGVQPFEAGGVAEAIRRHLNDAVPKAGRVNPEVTPFFEEVVACLLEKEPEKRFSGAETLAGVLEAGEASRWWRERKRKLRTEAPGRDLRRARVRRETPFAGRGSELEGLLGIFERVRDGGGEVLLIEGEPGVGKSRLLEEFFHALETRGTPHHALYGSAAPGARDALAQAILDHLGEDELAAKVARLLPREGPVAPGLAAYLSGLPPDPGTPAVPADALPVLLGRLVRALAAAAPVVLAVEDLHFASAEERSRFLALARSERETRLLLVGTYRDGLEDPGLAALLPEVRHWKLGRLDEAAVLSILETELGAGASRRDLARRIAVTSDGNPLFVDAMIRELREREPADAEGTEWVKSVTVPTSVRSLLEQRLAGIDDEDRALLDLGAVQGFRFDPELTAEARKRSGIEVLERLAALERKSGVVRGEGVRFRFDHHLLQELLYEALPASLRTAYHKTLARTLEARGAPGPGDDRRAAIAEHYLKGGDPGAAGPHVLDALDLLGSRYRSAKLIELAELALAGAGEDTLYRADIQLRLADCLFLLGRRDEELAAARDAFALAERAGDASRAARARLIEGRTMVDEGKDAFEVLEDARERAREAGDQETESAALGQLGHANVRAGQFERAREFYRAQIDLAREGGDARQEAEATYYLGEALLGEGRLEEAIEYLERSLGMFPRMAFARAEARALADLATARVMLGRYEGVGETFERSLAKSREIGFLEGEALALGNYSKVAIVEGDLEKAETLLDAWDDASRTLRSPFLDAYRSFHRADLHAARGDTDRAAELYEETLAAFRALGAHFGVAEAAVALGRLFWTAGDPGRARPPFEEAEKLVRENGLADPDPLPAAYLELLDGGDASGIEVPEARQVGTRAEAHLVLHLAGAGDDHLARSREILEGISAHLEGEAKDRFWRNNQVAARVGRG